MPQHVVIIGAVAAGPKAACRFKRLEPESRVTMVDRSDRISYGGCGIPFFVSGELSSSDELRSTSFHMLRDERFFRDAKGVDALTRTEALCIDREARTVRVRNLDTGEESVLRYDKLVLAMGSRPRRLGVPGEDLDGVYTIHGLGEAETIRDRVAKGRVGRAVVVGGGLMGLEMAVAFVDMWGLEVEVVEIGREILPGLCGPGLGRMARLHMERSGVVLRLGERVVRLEGRDRVEAVVTDRRRIEADLVVVCVGAEPNGELARAAGLEVSERGAVLVDETMRTSDPDILAGGDCVEVRNLVTGKPGWFPFGSLANRQGRVVGTNLAGGDARFEGAVGTWCLKLFDQAAAGVGLSLPEAEKAGLDAMSVHVTMFDRAHFHPDKMLMSLDLLVERGTGRVLGLQGLSEAGDALVGKVSAVAGWLGRGLDVQALSNLEMAYSPPFNAALDVLNVASNVADNLLAGRNRVVTAREFEALWADEAGDVVFLDCRAEAQSGPLAGKYPGRWKGVPQDELDARKDEIPVGRRMVVVCNNGSRSYEARLQIMRLTGRGDVASLEGGMAGLKALGIDL